MDREATALMRLRLTAPAKLNLSLEVLRIRPDGYHELRSVLQTVDLRDIVTLGDSDHIELTITGDADRLADAAPESNLAFRAAAALRERVGVRRGVTIELEKHIPVAAGLGGGSSDAAAVLRGLNRLWSLGHPDDNLVEIAAEIGSDPPFFVVGGTAAVSGRGEHVEQLPDAIVPRILLATPPPNERGEKTSAMFDALTPDHFSDGYVTIGVRDVIMARRPIVEAEMNNIFERVTSKMQPETALAMDALIASGLAPHLAGSGPSFFLLLEDDSTADQLVVQRVRELGFEARILHALPRADALRIEEI